MDLLKIYNGGNYAHVSSVYNFCSSSNLIKFIRTFIRQFLKSNNMGLLKIHNGGNNAHAQVSTVINFCWSSNSTKLTRTFHFDDIFRSSIPLLWKKIRVEVFLRIFIDDQKVE